MYKYVLRDYYKSGTALGTKVRTESNTDQIILTILRFYRPTFSIK